jgi:eukaryotic-like serine/threonine-protein kinase
MSLPRWPSSIMSNSVASGGDNPEDRAKATPRAPKIGDVIAGKYEIERVLGSGGMGVVVAARHKQLGHRVAIKFMRDEAARDARAAQRFLREAQAAVALSSAHATRMLDVGTLETGEPYMVMEYLAGEDLSATLRQRGPLGVSEAVAIVLQAIDALAEAHSLGIVHRDLKPANLFVAQNRDGSTAIKVLDFGISKTIELDAAAPEGLTASGLVMGSPGYMSPEQVRDSKSVDARTDIWALGVILYEMLTGVRPFLGDTLGNTLAKILSESPTPIRELNSSVPKALADTIASCFERKLDRRTQTVAELATKLAPFAPPESASLVARIARVSSAVTSKHEAAVGSGTMTIPPGVIGAFEARLGPTSAPNQATSEGSAPPPTSGAERTETSPAWLRSSAARRSVPGVLRRGRALALVAGAAVLVGGIGSVWMLRSTASIEKVPRHLSLSGPALAPLPVAEKSAASSTVQPAFSDETRATPPAEPSPLHDPVAAVSPERDAGASVRPPRAPAGRVTPASPASTGPHSAPPRPATSSKIDAYGNF